MILKRESIRSTHQMRKDSELQQIKTSDLFSILKSLSERELLGCVSVSGSLREAGYITADGELVAKLFWLLVESLRGDGVLLIDFCEREGVLEITARPKIDNFLPKTSTVAKISRIASLAGFKLMLNGGALIFSAEIMKRAAFSVYAITEKYLLSLFKNYF